MKSYILNAIPGALIPAEGMDLRIIPITPEQVPHDAISAIGHKDTAAIVSSILGREVPEARGTQVPPLVHGDIHYVALYKGDRLPEGTTTLPHGATLHLYRLQATSLDVLV